MPRGSGGVTATGSHSLYSCGAQHECVSPILKPVALYRKQVKPNASFLEGIAGVLGNLGSFYSQLDCQGDAISPIIEVLEIHRQLLEKILPSRTVSTVP